MIVSYTQRSELSVCYLLLIYDCTTFISRKKRSLRKYCQNRKYPNHSIFYNEYYISCLTLLILLKHGLHK